MYIMYNVHLYLLLGSLSRTYKAMIVYRNTCLVVCSETFDSINWFRLNTDTIISYTTYLLPFNASTCQNLSIWFPEKTQIAYTICYPQLYVYMYTCIYTVEYEMCVWVQGLKLGRGEESS